MHIFFTLSFAHFFRKSRIVHLESNCAVQPVCRSRRYYRIRAQRCRMGTSLRSSKQNKVYPSKRGRKKRTKKSKSAGILV